MTDDHAQLRHYVVTGAEDAFAAVVRYYLPLVYGAALRRVGGDVHRAQDVTQAAFTELARNARALAGHPDVAGWLFTTTRFLAAKTVRAERRRADREHTASLTSDTMSPEQPVSQAPDALHAVLDDVLMELRQLDRQVILLRFHQGLRLAAIAGRLGASENAIQKRLDRALDRLREKLARRGITSTAAAVAAAFEQQAAIAMPSGLAAAVLSAGLAGSVAGGGIFSGTTVVAVSKLQASLAAAVVLALGGALAWKVSENRARRETTLRQAAAAVSRVAALRQEFVTLRDRTATVEADAAKLEGALRAAASPAPPAPRQLTDDRTRMTAANQRGSQLVREGNPQAALDVYLTCYRELSSRGGVERQLMMSAIKGLGRTYPAALTALQELRDAAVRRVMANLDDRDAISEVAQLNERLGQNAASVALHDSLPPNHPGRQLLALIAGKAFLEARRYRDVLVGEPFGSMMTNFDRMAGMVQRETGPGATSFRESLVKDTLADIEALTGAGQLAEAKILTDKLRAIDDSEATQAALKRHIERATQSPGR
jgi:RNA polymerase sigma factor (sigma-70 family)